MAEKVRKNKNIDDFTFFRNDYIIFLDNRVNFWLK